MATLAFIVAFSNFANFGILARERVQVLPFFLAFVAATAARRTPIATTAEAADDGGDSGERTTNPGEPAQPTGRRYRITRRWRAPDAAAG
jgi:hypothetical protein